MLSTISELRLLVTVNAVNNSRRTEATGHSECCQQFQENYSYWSKAKLWLIPGKLRLLSQWMLSTIPRQLRLLVTMNAVNKCSWEKIPIHSRFEVEHFLHRPQLMVATQQEELVGSQHLLGEEIGHHLWVEDRKQKNMGKAVRQEQQKEDKTEDGQKPNKARREHGRNVGETKVKSECIINLATKQQQNIHKVQVASFLPKCHHLSCTSRLYFCYHHKQRSPSLQWETADAEIAVSPTESPGIKGFLCHTMGWSEYSPGSGVPQTGPICCDYTAIKCCLLSGLESVKISFCMLSLLSEIPLARLLLSRFHAS